MTWFGEVLRRILQSTRNPTLALPRQEEPDDSDFRAKKKNGSNRDDGTDPDILAPDLLAACKENNVARVYDLLGDGAPPAYSDPTSGTLPSNTFLPRCQLSCCRNDLVARGEYGTSGPIRDRKFGDNLSTYLMLKGLRRQIGIVMAGVHEWTRADTPSEGGQQLTFLQRRFGEGPGGTRTSRPSLARVPPTTFNLNPTPELY